MDALPGTSCPVIYQNLLKQIYCTSNVFFCIGLWALYQKKDQRVS
jgi:hypothetical protein